MLFGWSLVCSTVHWSLLLHLLLTCARTRSLLLSVDGGDDHRLNIKLCSTSSDRTWLYRCSGELFFICSPPASFYLSPSWNVASIRPIRFCVILLIDRDGFLSPVPLLYGKKKEWLEAGFSFQSSHQVYRSVSYTRLLCFCFCDQSGLAVSPAVSTLSIGSYNDLRHRLIIFWVQEVF